MNTPPPSLLDLQRALKRSIIAHDDALASPWVLGDGIAPAARLDVYRNTFVSVLANALRLNYPAVCRLVGGDCFEGAAREFIRHQPPRRANLDDYGEGFAEFLQRFPALTTLEYLPDVARLEWAVSRALHAPDTEPLMPARLASLSENERGRVRFVPHPAVAVVHAGYPVDAIWRAVLGQDNAALASIDLASGPAWLLVHRGEAGITVDRLSEDAWHFAAALFSARPLHQALKETRCADAGALLASHLKAGHFAKYDIVQLADF